MRSRDVQATELGQPLVLDSYPPPLIACEAVIIPNPGWHSGRQVLVVELAKEQEEGGTSARTLRFKISDIVCRPEI